ncbi:hypothetical protein HOY34_08975 [Xinfangfangia sp. D13-10-4-6]|uniref:hypothetical protein n=1 Tax=Pseudogemmobacter hezensis TaxID=2737662 RepID=UPI001554B5C6|nr:hypothetical protein [Pseudogemmobacter hezensis]NPD15330.1 hypothetical protein [Pseudogemmobacter hezensis]
MKAVSLAVFSLLGLGSGIGMADDRLPETSFFTGVYERVGKDAAESPGLIDDLVRIVPASEGWGLMLYPCAAEPGGEATETAEKATDWPLELRAFGHNEVPNILYAADDAADGTEGAGNLWCQYFSDHGNYPIFNCRSQKRGTFTLWPITDERMEACMSAAGQPHL